VANDVSAPGAGFEHDTNQVLILGADGSAEKLPVLSKAEVARCIMDVAARRLHEGVPQ
jgi:phosphopantothenoylcysteine decarboxylase / phosphopantothenate---cysteine ligase